MKLTLGAHAQRGYGSCPVCLCVCQRPSSATGATQRQVGILAVSVSCSLVCERRMSVECAVSAFHSEVKLGPDYVCTCCHRMMYRKSVILCNKPV